MLVEELLQIKKQTKTNQRSFVKYLRIVYNGFSFLVNLLNINIGILKKFAVYGKDIESSYQ